MIDPADIAFATVLTVMAQGEKTHPHGSWADEDPEDHLLKAARHVHTHLLIKRGTYPPSDENHLKNALCRLAMAVAIEEGGS